MGIIIAARRLLLSKPNRRSLAPLLLLALLLVLLLEYIPIQRVHQGWEDEVYWLSTCLSMLRHQGAIPSVLADFPGTQSPLRFYGPVLFWLGAAFLKLFGTTLLSWRTYTYLGRVAVLATSALLFRRAGWAGRQVLAAVFILSLSVTYSFAFTLPGRPDSWGVAILIAAMALPAKPQGAGDSLPRRWPLQWILFGMLLGVAICTSPRTWPVVLSMMVTLPLVIRDRRLACIVASLLGTLVTVTCILLPLHMSPWSFLAYVRAASSGDPRDISPVMGGAWGYGHSLSQTLFYGLVLLLIALLQIARWRSIPAFHRWLIACGLLNLGLDLLLVSGVLRGPTYWGFLLEISAVLGFALPALGGSRMAVRAIAVVLLAYMITLRAARELPVYIHWQRDPASLDRSVSAVIPAGALVYGPLAQFFYPAIHAGADYRYAKDWTTPGRSSVPGRVGMPAPMTDACHRDAYLIWSDQPPAPPLAELPYATASKIADHVETPVPASRIERILAHLPGGQVAQEDRNFSIYRLRIDPHYCTSRTSATR
jgi:hypothetical protein